MDHLIRFSFCIGYGQRETASCQDPKTLGKISATRAGKFWISQIDELRKNNFLSIVSAKSRFLRPRDYHLR
jgi:hypothetical protein